MRQKPQNSPAESFNVEVDNHHRISLPPASIKPSSSLSFRYSVNTSFAMSDAGSQNGAGEFHGQWGDDTTPHNVPIVVTNPHYEPRYNAPHQRPVPSHRFFRVIRAIPSRMTTLVRSAPGRMSKIPTRIGRLSRAITTKLGPSDQTFWDIGGYKPCVQRLSDAHKHSSEFISFIHERAKIEEEYAKKLLHWGGKLRKHVSSSSEYGSIRNGWSAIATESDDIAAKHLTLKDRLGAEVCDDLKRWSKDLFQKKSLSLDYKVVKELEEDFKKAQKPWSKRLSATNKAKSEYWSSCKALKSAQTAAENAGRTLASEEASPKNEEAKRKADEKAADLTKQVEASRKKYEHSLTALYDYKPQYDKDMRAVFDHSQELEFRRIEKFKAIFEKFQTIAFFHSDPDVASIYHNLGQTFNAISATDDTQLWANITGPERGGVTTCFEEYQDGMKPIASSSSSGGGKSYVPSGSDGITIRAIRPISGQAINSTLPASSSTSRSSHAPSVGHMPAAAPPPVTKQVSYNPFSEDGGGSTDTSRRNSQEVPSTAPVDGVGPIPAATPSQPPQALHESTVPVDSEKEKSPDVINGLSNLPANDEASPIEADHHHHNDEGDGELVEAIYDYEAVEDDEMTLVKGDFYIRQTEIDSQGWCKGQCHKNPLKHGLFPGSYVKSVTDA